TTNAPKNTANASTPAQVQPPAPVDEVSMDNELYATNCMICHKEDGTGGKVTIEGKTLKSENLTADKFKKASDEKLTGYVMDGVPDEGMPAFGAKLDAEQIKSIIAHVRTLQQ
ncbi:MAG: cytochrome c, partial [Pyrinomonadaceae bacterium]